MTDPHVADYAFAALQAETERERIAAAAEAAGYSEDHREFDPEVVERALAANPLPDDTEAPERAQGGTVPPNTLALHAVTLNPTLVPDPPTTPPEYLITRPNDITDRNRALLTETADRYGIPNPNLRRR